MNPLNGIGEMVSGPTCPPETKRKTKCHDQSYFFFHCAESRNPAYSRDQSSQTTAFLFEGGYALHLGELDGLWRNFQVPNSAEQSFPAVEFINLGPIALSIGANGKGGKKFGNTR